MNTRLLLEWKYDYLVLPKEVPDDSRTCSAAVWAEFKLRCSHEDKPDSTETCRTLNQKKVLFLLWNAGYVFYPKLIKCGTMKVFVDKQLNSALLMENHIENFPNFCVYVEWKVNFVWKSVVNKGLKFESKTRFVSLITDPYCCICF